MSYDFEAERRIQEKTARDIKRQLSYYLKILRGRHPRLLGGLAGVPITPELKEAVTGLEHMATHPLFPPRLVAEIRALQHNLVEPALDMYHDVPISIDDILYGKQRPTQLEVLGSRRSEEEKKEMDKLEGDVTEDAE